MNRAPGPVAVNPGSSPHPKTIPHMNGFKPHPSRQVPARIGRQPDQAPWPESRGQVREARPVLYAVLEDPPMRSIRFSPFVFGALAMVMLLACQPAGPTEVKRQMARRTAELDRLATQAGTAGLPPVRILFPVGGHDGDPPAGTRPPFSVRRASLEARNRLARPQRHPPRLGTAWRRSGMGRDPGQDGVAGEGGAVEGNVAAAIPSWDEQGLGPNLFLAGGVPMGANSEAGPRQPAEAGGSAHPFLTLADPQD